MQKVLYWASRLLAAIIMLQTLFYKFSGSPESIYIFNRVGMEPWGRFAVGGAELLAAILLILSRTVWMGAVLTFGLMSGAIVMHIAILGIEVQNDGGLLFAYAMVCWVCSIYLMLVHKQDLKSFLVRR